MLKFFKKICLSLIILLLISFIPIYATVRLVVPNKIIEKINENLPEGSSFYVETVSSNLDMSISYEGVLYSDSKVNIIIPELIIKTLPNLKKPFEVEAKKFEVFNPNSSIVFENVRIKTVFNQLNFENLDLQGSFEKLNALEATTLLNVNFVISGLKNSVKNIDLKAQKIIANLNTPQGPLNLFFNESEIFINKTETLGVNFLSKQSILDLSKLNKDEDLILQSDEVKINFSFLNELQLSAPFDIDIQKTMSNSKEFAENIKIVGKAKWRDIDNKCKKDTSLLDKFNCGKLTDFLSVDLLLNDKNGKIRMSGDGYCVAPKSGCLQEIKAKIESNDTSQVFTSLIQSGVINPVISGVLMGSLLSSNEEPSHTFQHAIKFAVKGSQIMINGEPLLK